MKIILHNRQNYILRFDAGEEAMRGLKDFCQRQNILGAYFSGIGAAREIVISWYDTDKQAYCDKIFRKKLEIAGFWGVIALMTGEEVVVHAHGSFGDENFETYSGHVKKLVVSATCEIYMQTFGKKLKRQPNQATGLNLLV